MNLTEFHALCRRVEAGSRAKPRIMSLQVAASYARAGMGLSDPEEARVQALYILDNLAHWRGTEAAEVRAKLKEFTQ